jgi:hypothetical protein
VKQLGIAAKKSAFLSVVVGAAIFGSGSPREGGWAFAATVTCTPSTTTTCPSITSTGQNHPKWTTAAPYTPVPTRQPPVPGNYSVIVSNDLGMHCADFDARIATILPLFNVLHAQIISKGTQPTILDSSKVSVKYSATYNPADPVTSVVPSASTASVAGTLAPNGSVFKSNFWDNVAAWKSFYPLNVPLASYFPSIGSATGAKNYDVGLPVPDLYSLYLAPTSSLVINQETNPDVTAFTYKSTTPLLHIPNTVTTKPYDSTLSAPGNVPQLFKTFEPSFPVFSKNFGASFGYVAQNTKWFAAEGIPAIPFDDYGRENPFPLMHVEAALVTTPNTALASTDVVTPVGGETNCKNCHLPTSAGGNGSATKRTGITWMTPANDPAFANGAQTGTVPKWVAEEWAADINILMLHDNLHPLTSGQLAGKALYTGFNATTGRATNKPVACQTCHYTPALDLTQAGPQGTDKDPAGLVVSTTTAIPDGLMQQSHETMSRVMHYSHSLKTDLAGKPSFSTMPPPPRPTAPAYVDPITKKAEPVSSSTWVALDGSCYQCHPGERTKCLRGPMYSEASTVCQDCHGNMAQIGNDFSKNILNPGGTFITKADFYTNAATPRVPWLNEPTCGSCHTGDANSNFAQTPPTGKTVIPASKANVADSIRLLQAYFSNDANAKPIIPTNKRFAEPAVTSPAAATGNAAAAGNPQLFRLSVDKHGGVFCEGCHGATHAEWPVGDGSANYNDNLAATQLQGHSGKITECNTCHTGTSMSASLNGPHGMHPVGSNGFSASWTSGHGDFAEHNITECKACHGTKGEGTVLGVVAVERANLKCKQTMPGAPPCQNEKITLPANYKVTCNTCHQNYVTNP